MRKKWTCLLVALFLVLGNLAGVTKVSALEDNLLAGVRNLALNKSVEVSSTEVSDGRWTGNLVVDGDKTSDTSRWSSAFMRNGSAAQTPQWLIMDLQAPESQISSIVVSFYKKVWAAKYRIETCDTKTGEWVVVKSFERADGSLPDNPVDTITDVLKLKRYVRFYFETMNTSAAWNALSVKEIEIIGTQNITGNLALSKNVEVSGLEVADGRWTGNLVVDGDKTTVDSRWSSGIMKNGTSDTQTQTPQWLIIDLQAPETQVSSIEISYFKKVWAAKFRIETCDTKTGQWQVLKSIERASGSLPDNAIDTITDVQSLKRYVRFYFEKLNAVAGGNALSIKEIEINGSQEYLPPVPSATAQQIINGITSIPSLTVNSTKVIFPEIAEGFSIGLVGSDVENIITNGGVVTEHNIGARNVDVIVQVTNNANPEDVARKSFVIQVEDKTSLYPNLYPEIISPNKEPKVIPSIQEWYGYNGNFILKPTSRILINDAGNVGLQKVAKNMQTDLKEFTGYTLSIQEVSSDSAAGSDDIYIESLAEDIYDTGKEGYLMVTNDKGIKIYSNTYTGCFYGTITTMQILWQDKESLAVPKGVIRDYPKYEIRGAMLDIARTPYRLQLVQDYAKVMSWYKMNEYHLHINDDHGSSEGAHRLESKEFPSLKSYDKAKYSGAEYYNNIYGNPHYTQEEWIELQNYSKELGVNILTEIDTPSHSYAYTQYALNNPDNLDWLGADKGIQHASNPQLLALTGPNAERAKRFATTLLEEYTNLENPVFLGDVVHIGGDEYWNATVAEKEAFRQYIEELRTLLEKNGKTARMWGALEAYSGSTQVGNDMQIDLWYNGYENAKKRMNEGYKIINVRDSLLYGNPGRDRRDVVNSEAIFKDWNPTMLGDGLVLDKGEPNLIGAKTALWGDESQQGIIERDLNQRILRGVAVVSEKTWGGTKADDTYPEYELKFNALQEGPGTKIAMSIDSKSAVVAEYDFENVKQNGDNSTVYDISGNGYDANITGGEIVKDGNDTYLKFNGNSLMTTPLKTVSYPYTVSFDLKLGSRSDNDKEASLFSGYDGRLQVADRNGELTMERCYFEQSFGYTVPEQTKVNVTMVGTFQGTKLYINGKLYKFLSQETESDTISSFVLPLEKIGAGFTGYLANLKVYNKALSPEIIAGMTTNEVNVAQNMSATGESHKNGENGDVASRRVNIPSKAVDGDGRNLLGEYTGVSTEVNSKWQGYHDDDYLMVDMGVQREVSKVVIQWNGSGYASQFKLQASQDGKTWTDIYSNNANIQVLSSIEFAVPVKTRFIKMQGVRRNGTNNYSIQEFQVCETVDKTGLEESFLAANNKIKDKGISFETTNELQKALFEAAMFAKAMINNPMATKAVVAGAEASLKSALAAFAGEIDLVELSEALESAQDKYDAAVVGSAEGQYPQSAKDGLLLAINEAKAVNENEDSTQEEVNEAVTKLNSAIANFDSQLISSDNKRALNTAIGIAQTKYDAATVGGEVGQYPKVAKYALLTAINVAKAIVNNAASTQANLDAAVKALTNVMNVFETSVITQ